MLEGNYNYDIVEGEIVSVCGAVLIVREVFVGGCVKCGAAVMSCNQSESVKFTI